MRHLVHTLVLSIFVATAISASELSLPPVPPVSYQMPMRDIPFDTDSGKMIGRFRSSNWDRFLPTKDLNLAQQSNTFPTDYLQEPEIDGTVAAGKPLAAAQDGPAPIATEEEVAGRTYAVPQSPNDDLDSVPPAPPQDDIARPNAAYESVHEPPPPAVLPMTSCTTTD